MVDLQEREGDIEKAKIIRPMWSRLKRFLNKGRTDGEIDSEYFAFQFRPYAVDILMHDPDSGISVFDNYRELRNKFEFDGGDFAKITFLFGEERKGRYVNSKDKIMIWLDHEHFFNWLSSNLGKSYMRHFGFENIQGFLRAVDDENKNRRKKKVLDTLSEMPETDRVKLVSSYLLESKRHWKGTFFHEFQHFIDDHQFMGYGFDKSLDSYPGSSGDMSKEQKKKYYNHPVELEAFFRASAESYFEAIRNKPKLQRVFTSLLQPDRFTSDKINKAMRWLMEHFKSYMPKEFWHYLTDENKQRIKKRMYSLIKSQVKEVLRHT